MTLTQSEIYQAILNALFEQDGDPKSLEEKYKEQPKEFSDFFELNPGDEISTPAGRYILTAPKVIPCGNKSLRATFIPAIPSHFLKIRKYTTYKVATLKHGITPDQLISSLSGKINHYLLVDRWADEAQNSPLRREELGILRKNANVRSFLKKNLNRPISRDELILKLYNILKNSFSNINPRDKNMVLHYVARILLSCNLETGSERHVQHRLYQKFKTVV